VEIHRGGEGERDTRSWRRRVIGWCLTTCLVKDRGGGPLRTREGGKRGAKEKKGPAPHNGLIDTQRTHKLTTAQLRRSLNQRGFGVGVGWKGGKGEKKTCKKGGTA